MQRSRLTEITKLVPDDTRITKFCVTYLCTYVSTERIRTWIRTCEDSSPVQVHDAYIPVPASSTGKDIAHRTRYKVVPDQGYTGYHLQRFLHVYLRLVEEVLRR